MFHQNRKLKNQKREREMIQKHATSSIMNSSIVLLQKNVYQIVYHMERKFQKNSWIKFTIYYPRKKYLDTTFHNVTSVISQKFLMSILIFTDKTKINQFIHIQMIKLFCALKTLIGSSSNNMQISKNVSNTLQIILYGLRKN